MQQKSLKCVSDCQFDKRLWVQMRNCFHLTRDCLLTADHPPLSLEESSHFAEDGVRGLRPSANMV